MSWFYDPALAPAVGRPIDVCYEVTAGGERASGGPCGDSTDDGQTLGVTYDDPRSRFNGAGHFVDVNGNRVDNDGGPETWFTDAYGRHGQTSAFPGSIRQRIASMDNFIGVDAGGPTIGDDRYTRRRGLGRRTDLLAGGHRRGGAPGLYASRSAHRTFRIPPGSSRSRVKTWVMVTIR